MSYIREIRKLIGNTPLIMAGAAALIFDEAGRLLLLRRTDNGCWGLPGGAMEPGESLEETARRETWEETGLEIGDITLFKVFSGPELYYCYPDGAQIYNVTAVYVPKTVTGGIQLDPAEHTEIGFFEVNKFPIPVSPPIEPILECLKLSEHIPT
jgi:8-oxo-dGTP pyrophosphatase MutT (NUDIX family)